MGAFTYNAEHTSAVPPERLFKALVLDSDNLFPKVIPDCIKSSEILEGDGGPGTVKKITFPESKYNSYQPFLYIKGWSFLFWFPSSYIYSTSGTIWPYLKNNYFLPTWYILVKTDM